MKKMSSFEKYFPAAALTLALLSVLAALRPAKSESEYNWDGFARLPVLAGGLIKPLDSIARNSLLILSGRQTLEREGRDEPPIVWLADMLFVPTQTHAAPVFEIDDPDVLGILNIRQEKTRRFSFCRSIPT